MERTITVSEKINIFIAENGGNERDALNVALARLELAEQMFKSANTIHNWDDLAECLKDEYGESLIDPEGSEDDPFNWWLVDVSVADIVDFIKNY